MNIIRHELKSNLKAFIIWSVALSIIFLTASTEFEAYYGNQEIIEFMSSYAPLFNALGVDVEDITTPIGFLTLVSFYIYLPLSIYAALLGTNIISKEEKDKTAEFLFTMPVTRKKVITAKLITSVIYMILIDAVVVGINIIAYLRFDLTSTFYQFTWYLFIGVLFTELMFLFIGMFLSSVLKQHKLAGSITLGIIIATFMLSMLVGFVDEASFLQYFTPFEYFKAAKMARKEFEFLFIAISVLIITFSCAGVYYFYQKRDLTL